MKRTRGKWVKDYGGTRGHIKAVVSGRFRTPTVCRYDRFGGGFDGGAAMSLTDEEIEANGILIESAPDMLEACEAAYTHLSIMCNALGEWTTPSDVDVLNTLETTIRKAGGVVMDFTGKVK